MSESKGPSTEAIALYTNVFGCVPDTEALEAGDVWEIAHIDAALRRAKAEGAREAIKVCRDRMLLWQSHGGAKLASPHSHLSIEGEYQVIIDDLDARAAQIEEGDK